MCLQGTAFLFLMTTSGFLKCIWVDVGGMLSLTMEHFLILLVPYLDLGLVSSSYLHGLFFGFPCLYLPIAIYFLYMFLFIFVDVTCSDIHCHHGGSCIIANGRPTCLCSSGFTGSQCKEKIPLICRGALVYFLYMKSNYFEYLTIFHWIMITFFI